MTNQNPEQQARDHIDSQLLSCGWVIQDKRSLNLSAADLRHADFTNATFFDSKFDGAKQRI
jgi:hypothetical protein